MTQRFLTKITASGKLWQEIQTKQINTGSGSKITKLQGDQIQFESTENPEPDIIELSIWNPDQPLVVTYSGEDQFENLITTYRYQNGIREFVKEEYEYWFEITDKDKDKLPPGLYERFQQKALEYFKAIDNYRIRRDESEPTFQEIPVKPLDNLDDSILIPSVELWEHDFKISAKKFGLTYLMIKVERIQGLKSTKVNEHLCEEYDDRIGKEYMTYESRQL
jgi:hypothetical protein